MHRECVNVCVLCVYCVCTCVSTHTQHTQAQVESISTRQHANPNFFLRGFLCCPLFFLFPQVAELVNSYTKQLHAQQSPPNHNTHTHTQTHAHTHTHMSTTNPPPLSALKTHHHHLPANSHSSLHATAGAENFFWGGVGLASV